MVFCMIDPACTTDPAANFREAGTDAVVCLVSAAGTHTRFSSESLKTTMMAEVMVEVLVTSTPAWTEIGISCGTTIATIDTSEISPLLLADEVVPGFPSVSAAAVIIRHTEEVTIRAIRCRSHRFISSRCCLTYLHSHRW